MRFLSKQIPILILRWRGPTSLQTVKMNECKFFTVCTMFGVKNIKLK